MDERRITRVQDFIKSCSIVERNVNPIINTCIDGMIAAADSINATEVRPGSLPMINKIPIHTNINFYAAGG